jgi:hypothetical protein
VGQRIARTSLECDSGVFMSEGLCPEAISGDWSIVNMPTPHRGPAFPIAVRGALSYWDLRGRNLSGEGL